MRYVNVTDARDELLNIVKNQEPVIVTRNGQPAVAMVPFAEYQQLAAARDAVRNPEAFAASVSAHRRVQEGIRREHREEIIRGVTEEVFDKRIRDLEKLVIDKTLHLEQDLKQLQTTVQDMAPVSSRSTA